MSKSKTYQLDGKGSVAFHNEDGKLIRYGKGDTASAKELKEVPKRQQKFFSEVEEEAEDRGSETGDGETKPEDLTVKQLKKYFDDEEVEYSSDAKKDDLVQLYKSVR